MIFEGRENMDGQEVGVIKASALVCLAGAALCLQ